jgi:hypothetical protein
MPQLRLDPNSHPGSVDWVSSRPGQRVRRERRSMLESRAHASVFPFASPVVVPAALLSGCWSLDYKSYGNWT